MQVRVLDGNCVFRHDPRTYCLVEMSNTVANHLNYMLRNFGVVDWTVVVQLICIFQIYSYAYLC